MTADEFNEKYKAYIETGFETQGLEFDNLTVTEFLNNIFQDLIKIPGFKYSQIKLKFGTCRFYTKGLHTYTINNLIEQHINFILGK